MFIYVKLFAPPVFQSFRVFNRILSGIGDFFRKIIFFNILQYGIAVDNRVDRFAYFMNTMPLEPPLPQETSWKS